jgi:hypothetical protein
MTEEVKVCWSIVFVEYGRGILKPGHNPIVSQEASDK